MEELESKFKTKIEIAKDSLEFCKGNPQATLAECNTAMIEIGELKRKMQILKGVVENLHVQTKKAEKISAFMHERIQTCEYVSENLPKTAIQNAPPQPKVQAPSALQKSLPSTKEDEEQPKKISSTIPKIRYLSVEDYDSIPKYMKGRLSYDAINTAIGEFNDALGARYAFLSKGFQAMASIAMKKRYKVTFSLRIIGIQVVSSRLVNSRR